MVGGAGEGCGEVVLASDGREPNSTTRIDSWCKSEHASEHARTRRQIKRTYLGIAAGRVPHLWFTSTGLSASAAALEDPHVH